MSRDSRDSRDGRDRRDSRDLRDRDRRESRDRYRRDSRESRDRKDSRDRRDSREARWDDPDGYVVRVRGLPWTCTAEELLDFFCGCKLLNGKAGVEFINTRDGRASGEAYIQLETEDDMLRALELNRKHMGHRYIEVFKSKKSELEWALAHNGPSQPSTSLEGCVRLRGLPFGCTREDIVKFFSGSEGSAAAYDISPYDISPDGIVIPLDHQGRSTGEAFVQFVSQSLADIALGKHKEKMGHRYVEVFRCSRGEFRGVYELARRHALRRGPYDRPGVSSRGSYGSGVHGGSYAGGYSGGSSGGYGPDRNYDRLRPVGGCSSRSYNSYGSADTFQTNTGHCVHMRGIPFRSTEEDILEFFSPLAPVRVHIEYEANGRATGEADVDFASHDDAVRAMTRDKAHMKHRYVELFLNSTAHRGYGGGSNGVGCYSSSSSSRRGGGWDRDRDRDRVRDRDRDRDRK